MHLIEEHPTKREGIERRGSLRGDGACAGSQLSLPLEFRSHLHHQSLKHPAQRADTQSTGTRFLHSRPSMPSTSSKEPGSISALINASTNGGTIRSGL